MAEKLEGLRVYQNAMAFWRAVNAILKCPRYRNDRKLADQTGDANDSIPANISEGFEQPTDALFVRYLYHAKGSLAEVLARLREAQLKGYLTQEQLSDRLHEGERLSRSLGAFIRYLDTCGWKDRGRHRSRLRQQRSSMHASDPVAPGSAPEPRDSGPRDSGPRDSGPRDSGLRDSGPRDRETRDKL